MKLPHLIGVAARIANFSLGREKGRDSIQTNDRIVSGGYVKNMASYAMAFNRRNIDGIV